MIAASDLYYLLSGKESIKILDATYGGAQSPEQAFLGRRIEGAQFFDIDVVADQTVNGSAMKFRGNELIESRIHDGDAKFSCV